MKIMILNEWIKKNRKMASPLLELKNIVNMSKTAGIEKRVVMVVNVDRDGIGIFLPDDENMIPLYGDIKNDDMVIGVVIGGKIGVEIIEAYDEEYPEAEIVK